MEYLPLAGQLLLIEKKKSTFLTYVPVYVSVHKNAVLMAALREVLAPLELELHDTVGC